MITHSSLEDGFAGLQKLHQLISSKEIQLAGNRKLRIYGTLTCSSGKRMKKENRVFFSSEEEAIEMGYRCCRNCWCRQKKNNDKKTVEL